MKITESMFPKMTRLFRLVSNDRILELGLDRPTFEEARDKCLESMRSLIAQERKATIVDLIVIGLI